MGKGRSRSRAGLHAAIATLAITTGLGIAGAAGASGTAAEYFIDAHGTADTAWYPPTLTVQTNDTVTWRFQANAFHNVRSTSANWSFNPSGDGNPATGSNPHTFTAPGTYTFECEFHPTTMTGTITVQDDPVETPTPTPTPTATPTPTPIPQPGGGTHPTTPPPTAGTDTVKPTVRSLKATALRRAVRVKFRLSEPATVTVRVKRRGSRKVIKSARIQARAGTRTVTLRSKKLKKGRYTVDIQARDAFGNRSKLATKQLVLRG
jgi:plastocyanin